MGQSIFKKWLVTAFAIIAIFTLIPVGFAYAADEQKTVDPQTHGDWATYITSNTEEVGRIWTDKTVQMGDTWQWTGASDSGATMSPIQRGDSNFLVGFSALSSTSNIKSTITRPLDIVLVLDASGSMSDKTYFPVYGSDIKTSNKYYVLVDDEYKEVTRKNGSWGYVKGSTRVQVTPKSSASSSSGTQFYTQSATTKMAALKTAVNSFVDEIAAVNGGIDDSRLRHHVSVVKFSGDIRRVQANGAIAKGNETYKWDGHDYNYAQPLVHMDMCDIGFANTIKSEVNKISPAGATRADYGMEVAQDQFSRFGRPGVQKVVIFFTDGVPTSFSAFDPSVANGAITRAGALKDSGAWVYSIGVFGGADPAVSVDQANDFNRYMHAVSSNYPEASSYTADDMGSRVQGADFYKAATSASELQEIFKNIQEEISSSTGFPTQTTQGAASTSGYITFVDQLGDYMKVDSFKAIVVDGRVFSPENGGKPTVTSRQDGTSIASYYFKGEVGNALHPEGNLSSIFIEVTRASDLKTGDRVELRIPAGLIPLCTFEVNETTDEDGNVTCELKTTECDPMGVFYGVSLKEGVDEQLASGEDPDLNAYVQANLSDDGSVYFYSNKYSGSSLREGLTLGDAVASFTPALNNPFYYLQEDALLYEDESGTIPATSIEEGKSYYYLNQYYRNTGSGNAAEKVSSATLITEHSFEVLRGVVRANANGQLYIPAGSAKISSLHQLGYAKSENATGTAQMYIDPHWNNVNNPEYANIYLGNNGRLALDLPGTLSVSKELIVPDYIGSNGDASNKAFDFQISLAAPNGSELKASYAGSLVRADGTKESTTVNIDGSGKGTISLKDGETFLLYGLEDGVAYSVSEVMSEQASADGFYFKDVTAQGGMNPAINRANMSASGLIATGSVSEVSFVNEYRTPPITVSGFAGAKNFVGRPWADGDIFSFTIEPLQKGQSVPMPDEATVVVDYADAQQSGTYNEDDKTTTLPFSFGSITYTEPGIYKYHIYEHDPETGGRLPGVSYSLASYEATVVVSYNNQSEGLAATVTMKQVETDDGTSVDLTVDDKVAKFTNNFKVDDLQFGIDVTKVYTDNGNNPLVDGMFEFELIPVSGKEADGSVIAEKDVPKPARNKATNVGTLSSFLPITFTHDHAGNTYVYNVREVSGSQHGMIYDSTVYRLEVAVSLVRQGDEDVLKAVPNVFKDGEPVSGSSLEERLVFHNSYTPDSVSGTIAGQKTLAGRDMLESDEFKFVIAGADNDTKDAISRGEVELPSTKYSVTGPVANGSPQDFSFNATFKKPGTYHFSISEVKPSDGDTKGISYDEHVSLVTVVVQEETSAGALTGKLKIDSITYDNGEAAGTSSPNAHQAVEFVNTYEPANYSYAGFGFTKTLIGRTMHVGEFDFVVSAADDSAAAKEKLKNSLDISNANERASGIADTMVALEGLVFTKEDAGKTFDFLVSEVVPADDEKKLGVTYDGSQYKASIEVDDNLDGTLDVVTSFFKWDGTRWQPVAEIAFSNTYKALPVTFSPTENPWLVKVIAGRDWTANDSFTFVIEKVSLNGSTDSGDLDRMPLPGNGENGEATAGAQHRTVITGAANGVGEGKLDGDPVHFTLGPITFSEPGVYAYRIFEEQPAADEEAPGMIYSSNVASIVFDVSDGGEGRLVVSTLAANGTFVNEYTSSVDYVAAGGLAISKKLDGRDMTDGQFSFTVKPKDAATAAKFGIDESGKEVRSPAANDGSVALVSFLDAEKIIFTHDDVNKTYELTIKEDVPSPVPAGYTYDDAVRTVAITTVDNEDGTLSVVTKVTADGGAPATYTYTTGDVSPDNAAVVAFVNKYDASTENPGGTAVQVRATKVLNGKGIELHDGDFKFILEPNPKPAGSNTMEAFNEADGSITFDAINYDVESLKQAVADGYATVGEDVNGKRMWTLRYVLYEETANLVDGVTSTVSNFDINVIVVDNGDGTLAASAHCDNASQIQFVNTYAVSEPVSVSFIGSKVIASQMGHNPPDIAGKYTFTLEPVTPGAPMPANAQDNKATAVNDEDGNIKFDEIVFPADLLKNVAWAEDGRGA